MFSFSDFNIHFSAKSTDVAPEFIEVYSDTIVTEKQNMTLTATVTGKPTPDIKWFRWDIYYISQVSNIYTIIIEVVEISKALLCYNYANVYDITGFNKHTCSLYFTHFDCPYFIDRRIVSRYKLLQG